MELAFQPINTAVEKNKAWAVTHTAKNRRPQEYVQEYILYPLINHWQTRSYLHYSSL